MKKIIDGKMYNTETATEIHHFNNGLPYSDFNYLEESLYKKKDWRILPGRQWRSHDKIRTPLRRQNVMRRRRNFPSYRRQSKIMGRKTHDHRKIHQNIWRTRRITERKENNYIPSRYSRTFLGSRLHTEGGSFFCGLTLPIEDEGG